MVQSTPVFININLQIKRAIRKEWVKENRRLNYETSAENKHIQYGLGKNTLLMKVNNSTIDRWRNHKYLYIRYYNRYQVEINLIPLH